MAEVGFKMLYAHAKAAFNCANVPMAIRYKVFFEWFHTVTKLDGLVVVEHEEVNAMRHCHVYGHEPK